MFQQDYDSKSPLAMTLYLLCLAALEAAFGSEYSTFGGVDVGSVPCQLFIMPVVHFRFTVWGSDIVECGDCCSALMTAMLMVAGMGVGRAGRAIQIMSCLKGLPETTCTGLL